MVKFIIKILSGRFGEIGTKILAKEETVSLNLKRFEILHQLYFSE